MNNRLTKYFSNYYLKDKFYGIKNIRYLFDSSYEGIKYLFNKTVYIDTEPQKIKSYEAKPYDVEYYGVKSNQIKYREINYIDIKNHEIKSCDINYMCIKQIIKSYETEPYGVEYYEVKSDEIKYHHEIDYIDI